MGHLLLIVNVFMWASLSVADICSHLPGYTGHGTSCFKLYTTTKNWAAAEAACVKDGGHLASIHSNEEQDFVAALALVQLAGPWIGLSGTPPEMAWSDGTAMDYTKWYQTNPDAAGASCARVVKNKGYFWEDLSCGSAFQYMCRIDIADRTKAFFTKIPGGVPADPTVVPSSTQEVRSALQCAKRCKQDAQCVHFMLSEDVGKYLCETYSSLKRSPTAAPPTINYVKDV